MPYSPYLTASIRYRFWYRLSLIFNLDRFIVSTIRKETSLALNFYKLHPIILAVIIAIVISKPLEIKIFEKKSIPFY
jgi:hypothetical protein